MKMPGYDSWIAPPAAVLAVAWLALVLAVAPPTAGASPAAARAVRRAPATARTVATTFTRAFAPASVVREIDRELTNAFRRNEAAPEQVSIAANEPSAEDAPEAVLAEAKGYYRDLMREPTVLSRKRAPVLRDGARPPPAMSRPPSLPSRGNGVLLARALSYRGVPYRWGGATRAGLDCSGLLVRAARDLGQDLPHSAALLYDIGRPVPDDRLQLGDLVFFRDTYKPGISHVGIYEGGAAFLQASSAAGMVTHGDLRHPYYRRKYAGARRLSAGDQIVVATERWMAPTARMVEASFRLGEPVKAEASPHPL